MDWLMSLQLWQLALIVLPVWFFAIYVICLAISFGNGNND